MQKKPTPAYVHIPFAHRLVIIVTFQSIYQESNPVEVTGASAEEFRSYDIPKLRTSTLEVGHQRLLTAREVLLNAGLKTWICHLRRVH